jgi:hypothetical protein
LLLLSQKSFVSISYQKKLKIKIYKTVILPVVLYGCKTWSLTVREGNRLKAFKNRVARRIFGPKRRGKVAGGWKRLHNEELHNLYASPDIIRMMKSMSPLLASILSQMHPVHTLPTYFFKM